MTVKSPTRPDQTARELEALIEEARRRARRRRFGYAAGAVTVFLAVAAALLLGGSGDAEQARDDGTRRSAAAAEQSGLLFARVVVDSRDGVVYDEGVFAIDLSTGEVDRVRLRFNCGDTPFCLISTGGELVISTAERTTAYDPAARGRRQVARLGNGWITVPSTTDGRVWLGILGRGKLGGPYRRGLRAVREIDLEGNVIRSMRPPKGEWPVAAVDSGLIFEYGKNLRLWNLAERRFTTRIRGVYPTDTFGSLVASCRDACPKYLLTDTQTGVVTRIAPPAGYRWAAYGGAFSPDGSHLALPVAPVAETPGASHTVAVVDVRSRDADVIPRSPELEPTYRAMTWSSGGRRLLFVGEKGRLMSYRLGSDGLATHPNFTSFESILQMVSVRPRG